MLQFSTGRGEQKGEGRGEKGEGRSGITDKSDMTGKKKRVPRPADFMPEERFGDDFHDPRKRGGRRCIAWNGNAGRQCEVRAMIKKTVCQTHGGRTPSGAASTSFKTGRWSKDLDARLGKRYEEALAYQDLLDLREPIALTVARIGELLGDPAAAGETLDNLMDHLQGIEKAFTEQDANGVVLGLRQMKGAIGGAKRSIRVYRQVDRLTEQLRKLVDSESRRQIQAAQMITVTQAVTIMTAHASDVRDVITQRTDQETARIILAEVTRITNRYLMAGD